MKKLKLLIILMMMSFIGFSQNDTVTTSIQLEKPIVKLVIKDSIIFNYKNQLGNFESILNTKSNQLSLSQELSKRLEADLKKQKMKTKLMGGAGIVIAIGVAVLVN